MGSQAGPGGRQLRHGNPHSSCTGVGWKTQRGFLNSNRDTHTEALGHFKEGTMRKGLKVLTFCSSGSVNTRPHSRVLRGLHTCGKASHTYYSGQAATMTLTCLTGCHPGPHRTWHNTPAFCQRGLGQLDSGGRSPGQGGTCASCGP